MSHTIVRLPRGGGKTLTLLKLANEAGACIVGRNTDKLRQMAHELGYKNIKGFYNYADYIEKTVSNSNPYEKYFIDNFEEMARYFDNVVGISVSTD